MSTVRGIGEVFFYFSFLLTLLEKLVSKDSFIKCQELYKDILLEM